MKKRICESCNKSFDYESDMDCFEQYGFSRDNLTQCLCYDCAIDVIDSGIEGVYFEECEICGKRYDWVKDNADFRKFHDGEDISSYYKEFLCADCANDNLSDLDE